jgi:hypothetical protein
MKINPNMKLKAPIYRVSKKELSEDFSLSVMNEARKMIGRMDDVTSYHVASAYSTIYTRVSKERKNFMKDVDRHRDFYIVDVMVNTLVHDALTPETSTGKILDITSNNESLKKELEALKKRINFDQLLQDILPELCYYGDYFLKTKIDDPDTTDDDNIVKDQLDADLEDQNGDAQKQVLPVKKSESQGLLEIKDIVEQTEIIPLTQDGKRRSYLVHESGKIKIAHASEYIHFSLGGSRRRVKLFDELSERITDNDEVKKNLSNVPRFIRIGKSIFYGCLSKIRELELLEKLIPATKLSKLSQGTIVGVNLPDTYDLEKGLAAIKRVEGLLNKKIGVDPKLGELTVESIMATSGRYKAIPVFGDKGGIERIDYKETESDDLLSNVKDIRETVCDSIGIPYELIFKSDGDNKANILKRYTRYLKKLKMIQRSLQDGIRQIIKIHIANRSGISFKEEEIKIEFLSRLSEIDNLDNLEHMDITVSMLKNLKDFITDVMDENSPLDVTIDMSVFKSYINKNLATIGLTNLISDVKLREKPVEPELDLTDDDMDSVSLEDETDYTQPE